MSTRRAFLHRLTGAAAIAGLRVPLSTLASQTRSLTGATPGEEREVDLVRLCWCPPGKFVMGSPATETGRRSDEAQVPVTLSRGFWTGKFEVTQGEWRRVMGELPARKPSAEFGLGDDIPVYWVSFNDAEAFCRAATERARRSAALPAGWAFRLPTEAQWEYACRAGTVTATSFGEQFGQHQANFKAHPLNGARSSPPVLRATPVGTYPANAWGMCDMHGNVFEWCRDWYHTQLPGGTDPDVYESRGVPNRDGSYSRVRRGGAWNDDGWACRSALRLKYEPERNSDHIGFRVVVVAA
jgi:formylglycine-generating enzyme required for sulfatase activity